MMGQTIRGYQPSFGTNFGWSLRSKVMGTSDHFRYSGVAGETAMTSQAESFYFCHRAIRLPLLVIILCGVRLIRVAQLLVLLLVSSVKGRLLGQSIFVGNCQHLLRHLGFFMASLWIKDESMNPS
jgi:hypothetical protein